MDNTNGPMRIVGYVRCSTTEQANDGLSLQAQEGRLRAWCDAYGAELVELVVDAGVSGSKPLAARPGGARIAELIDARRPGVDALVVLRIDRLGRDAAETLTLLRKFRTSTLGLVSIADRLDLGTPQGRALAQMACVFAELERALIGQRTADALAELRRSGRVYGAVPYGWQNVDGNLVADQAEQAALVRIRELRAAGAGYLKAADALNAEGVPTKRGNPWAAMSVRSVLRTADKLAPAASSLPLTGHG